MSEITADSVSRADCSQSFTFSVSNHQASTTMPIVEPDPFGTKLRSDEWPSVKQFNEEVCQEMLRRMAQPAVPIPIQFLDPAAIAPTRAKENDAGHDLYALEPGYILPGQRALVRTGIAIAIPPGFYGRIAPRSSLAAKSGIDVLAGVVDATYRGEVKVALINLSDGGEEQVFSWKAGDRVAQLIIEKCYSVSWTVVEKLDETDRGQGGFGSSGS